MVATVLSLIGAFLFLYTYYPVPEVAQAAFPVSLLLLALAFFAGIVTYRSIFRSQQKLLGCAQELFFTDYVLTAQLVGLFAFTLISLALPEHSLYMAVGWIVLFGVAVDLLRGYIKRLQSYTYHPFLVERLKREIKKGDESKGLEWIGSAIDSVAKLTDIKAVTSAINAMNGAQELIQVYVKELVRQEMIAPPGPEGLTLSFSDKIQYVCIFTSERMKWVFENALRDHVKPVAAEALAQLGKIAVFFAKHNIRVASLPITFINDCASTPKVPQELLIRASLTLSETIKAFVAHSRETNESLRDLVLNTFVVMETVVKMIYKQNKGINPALLMQPFAEVGQFLGQESMLGVVDREELLKEIRRVFAEFQSLQLVIKSVEEYTEDVQDTTSTFSKDVPYMP